MPWSSSSGTAPTSASCVRCAPAAAAASATGWRWSRSCGWPSRPPWATSCRDSCWTPGTPRPWRTLPPSWCCATRASSAIGATGSQSGPSRAWRRPSSLPAAVGSRGRLRLDPEGHAARLLARCAWVPDLDAALAVRAHLPAGWRLVTRAGMVVDDLAVVRPAPGVSTLERRAALDDVTRQSTRLDADLESAATAAAEAAAARSRADARVAAASVALDAARRSRRLADEADPLGSLRGRERRPGAGLAGGSPGARPGRGGRGGGGVGAPRGGAADSRRGHAPGSAGAPSTRQRCRHWRRAPSRCGRSATGSLAARPSRERCASRRSRNDAARRSAWDWPKPAWKSSTVTRWP